MIPRGQMEGCGFSWCIYAGLDAAASQVENWAVLLINVVSGECDNTLWAVEDLQVLLLQYNIDIIIS